MTGRRSRLLTAAATALAVLAISGCSTPHQPPAAQVAAALAPGGSAVEELDPYDATESGIDRLHLAGTRVLCRLRLGADEIGRPDFGRLPGAVVGTRTPDGAAYWWDIRRLDLLTPVLLDRLRLCRDKGFDAVDGSALDGYRQLTGFPLSRADQLAFDRAVLGLARSLGLGAVLRVPVADIGALAGAVDLVALACCASLATAGQPLYVLVPQAPAVVTGAAPAGSAGSRTTTGS